MAVFLQVFFVVTGVNEVYCSKNFFLTTSNQSFEFKEICDFKEVKYKNGTGRGEMGGIRDGGEVIRMVRLVIV